MRRVLQDQSQPQNVEDERKEDGGKVECQLSSFRVLLKQCVAFSAVAASNSRLIHAAACQSGLPSRQPFTASLALVPARSK